MSERKPIDIEAVYAETMRRFPKTMEALRQSELAETPQPKGYSRDDAEGRIAEQLERLSKLPDSAMTTVFLGDLRKLSEERR